MIDYAKIEFDSETTGNLFEFCKAHRLGLADVDDQSSLLPSDFKFHLTLMYSRVTNPCFAEGRYPLDGHALVPESFDMFGPACDILALRLKVDASLADMFDRYGWTYGHVSDFMPFRPHVTIRGNARNAAARIDTLPLPDFPITPAVLVHARKKG